MNWLISRVTKRMASTLGRQVGTLGETFGKKHCWLTGASEQLPRHVRAIFQRYVYGLYNRIRGPICGSQLRALEYRTRSEGFLGVRIPASKLALCGTRHASQVRKGTKETLWYYGMYSRLCDPLGLIHNYVILLGSLIILACAELGAWLQSP